MDLFYGEMREATLHETRTYVSAQDSLALTRIEKLHGLAVLCLVADMILTGPLHAILIRRYELSPKQSKRV